nr:type II toxin-antitoxin system RelE/ParE family toxin [Pseudomonas aeruginosa]
MSEDEQESLAVTVRLLEERGPSLGHPHSSGINGSRPGHMRELRTQHGGRPFRTLYAFDPRRSAILPIGGDKTGDERWYELNVPIADCSGQPIPDSGLSFSSATAGGNPSLN